MNSLTKDDICWVWEIIKDKLTPYDSAFSFVGEELDVEFMVVTRRAVFRRGYKGMDPATIPQFKEGYEDKVVKRLLEGEGLDHLEFATPKTSPDVLVWVATLYQSAPSEKTHLSRVQIADTKNFIIFNRLSQA
ncbi:hypothetical protein ARMGADRAFT_1077987 [Armillaria gallica]|uniref:Uncharacterized protein n=1 Tax=Armillaria gallica TaxID=47427 RepID=A0A2H3DJ29_ARMGA|nr:hypothetical protein ARMGADRAFT_1077987 [Armillaria gallica]